MSSYGRIAVIIFAGLVLVGDALFALQMSKELFG